MCIVRLLVATATLMGADVGACEAQAAASAAIKATVHAGRRSPPKGPHSALTAQSQTMSFTPEAGVARVSLRTPAGEPIAVELDGATSLRLSLRASDPQQSGDSAAIECRQRVDAVAPHNDSPRLSPLQCEELVIRWPESADWPARLSISRTVGADGLHPRRFVAQFTIVAEY